MKNRKNLLPALLSIALVFSLVFHASALGASATVSLPDDRSVIHSMMDGSSLASAMVLNMPAGNVTPMVVAGYFNVVGIKSDGTVVAVGDNVAGQCDVSGWTNITQLAACSYHTVGLKSDGTVVVTGGGDFTQLATWNLILAVPPSQCPPIHGGGGCFIATTVYGTPMAEEVQILREFRDKYLLTNPVGKGLVGFYYKVSPPIAEFITEHPNLKPIVRAGLMPAVAMSTIVVNTTPAEKMAIAGLLALISVALAVWATRRRGRDPLYTRG